MRTFADNAGRTWTVTINVDAIKRVRDLAKVNLLEVAEGALLDKLVFDPVLLCDVIYAACKDQADAQKVSDGDFGRSMAGDAIDLATTALLEELVDFFPKARRGLLRKVLAKVRQVEAKVTAAAEAKIEDPELDARIERALREANDGPTSGGSSGSLPASSASIPAP
jgi:hypothetical protein